MAVLVLTNDHDGSADMVILALHERQAPVVRIDLGEFPDRLRVAARLDGDRWDGDLHARRSVRLSDIQSVYYRRPSEPRFPPMPEAAADFAEAEAHYGLGGVLMSLPCRWVNHPAAMARASYKPVQLAVAAVCGLTVPRTLITNDPDAAGAFVAEVGETLYKPMAASKLTNDPSRPAYIYATRITAADLDDRLRVTAHQLQEWIPKAHDVRLTVIGQQLFAVEIHAGSDAAYIDWRADYDQLTYQPCDVPDEVEAGVMALMGRLGLRFAAMDFTVTPAAAWTFLEVNPGGQWGWIQHAAGLPIAEAIAEDLAAGSV